MITKIDVKHKYSFPAIIGKENDEKEYSVYFPDLDVATSGIDMEDAINSAKELLNITIEGKKQDVDKMT